MSIKYPKYTGKDLIRVLSKFGFEVSRIKGSHHFPKHADGRVTTVPAHGNETIGPGLLNKISKDTDIDIRRIKT
jgi:predicted RNA binding protein YcfA (HicA-like mRNA interferase family)